MAEYIERTAAVKAVLRMRKPENSVAQNRMLSIIQMDMLKLPAADVAPVVRGRWVMHDDELGLTCECSHCHIETIGDGNYCPNCGARMKGESGDDAAD